jgi:hypothetical protein
VPLSRRPPELGQGLYERLLGVVLGRAQWGVGEEGEGEEEEEEEDDDEELVGFLEYREQVICEVCYRCYEVLRSRYVGYVEEQLRGQIQAYLAAASASSTSTHTQTHTHTTPAWQPLEAVIFGFRVVALDCNKRALLAFAAPQVGAYMYIHTPTHTFSSFPPLSLLTH